MIIEEEESGLTFELDKDKCTAKVINSPKCENDVFIPRSIKYNSKEYIITTISASFGENSKIETVNFALDSEVRTIESNAFKNFYNFKICIPANVTEIQYGWCKSKLSFEGISISPNNKNLKIMDDLIFGKSNVTSNFYDILYLSSYKKYEVIISPHIKKICPYAFLHSFLKYVEFPENSELESIGEKSFAETYIYKIKIPKSVKTIGKKAFKRCSNLYKIEFSENSELKTFSEKLFEKTPIKYLNIPENIQELKEGWCRDTEKLTQISISPKNKNFSVFEKKMIVGKSDNQSENFDTLYFVFRDVENIVIPSFIKRINYDSFGSMKKLRTVKFLEDSKLEIIDKFSFSKSTITEIFIPNCVKVIEDKAFFKCFNLKKVEFSKDSKLEKIGKYAFSESAIEHFKVPKHVKSICADAFYKCNELEDIEFTKDSELDFIGEYAFAFSSIKKFEIPKYVKVIKTRTFHSCTYLEKVTVAEGSELETIQNFVFSKSGIKTLILGQNVCELLDGWCRYTNSLTEISIPSTNKNFIVLSNKMVLGKSKQKEDNKGDNKKDDNKIDDNKKDVDNVDDLSYDSIYFVPRNISELSISPNVRQINSYSFSGCRKLITIKIPSDSQLEIIGKESFSHTAITTIFIPKHVKIIDDSCFLYCQDMRDVKFDDDSEIQIIGKNAFSNSTIQSITIPKSVTDIQEGAFNDCKCIKSFQFQEDCQLKIIKEKVFNNSLIKSITIPKNVEAIEKDAFNNCVDLREVYFPDDSKLTTIKEGAFSFCKIKKLKIPPQLKEIDEFYSIHKMKEFSMSSKNKYFRILDDKYILSKSDINSDNFDVIYSTICQIENVKIPSYIKKLGSYSFSSLIINTLEFEENCQLEIIDDHAFYHSILPDVIIIPKTVKIIGKESFDHASLNTILFEENSELQKIDDNAFFDSTLQQISLPSNLSYIGISAFSLTLIEKISIPKNIEIINGQTFSECQKLQTVEFAENSMLKIIGNNSFYNCRIKTISIPKKVQEIQFEAFFDCMDIEKFDFAEDSEIQTIQYNVFYQITNIFIPSKLKKLEDKWCFDMSLIESITVSPDNKHFAVIDDKYFVGKSNLESEKFDILYFSFCDNCIIPSYIKRIAPYAFANRENLQSVEFTDDSELEIIDDFAFQKSSITSITIPKHVKIIGMYAFDDSALETIEFVENSELEIIKDSAFHGSQIQSISLPSNVKCIEEDSFGNTKIEKFVFPNKIKFAYYSILNGCENLKEICFTEETELIASINNYGEFIDAKKINIPSKIDDLSFIFNGNVDEIAISPKNKYFSVIDEKMIVTKSDINSDNFDVLYYVTCNAEDVLIPSNIKIIGENSFIRCKKIKSVKFQENSELEIIDKYSFMESSIEEIKLPKHLRIIEKEAFNKCENLKKLEFQEYSELEFICSSAFQRTSLTEIIIPKSVKIIDDNAFVSCENLERVEFSKESKLERIGKFAFNETSIHQIIIPKTVKSIEMDAFYYCKNLEEVLFEENNELNYIGEYAFANTSIKNFTIPKNVEILKERTFYNCKELLNFTAEEDSKLRIIQQSAFANSRIESLNLGQNICELLDGWCRYTNYLNEVKISQKNPNFLVLSNKMILGKSTSKNDVSNNFDVVYFAPRNIEETSIPSYVKKINSFAFSGCKNFNKILIPKNSKLEVFCDESFSFTAIDYLFIPKQIKLIGEDCFLSCQNLNQIDFDPDSNVTIRRSAFSLTKIKGIVIPRKIKKMNLDLFNKCNNFNSIEVLNDDDENVFYSSSSFIGSAFIISFPNAHNVSISYRYDYNENLVIYISCHAKIELVPKFKNY